MNNCRDRQRNRTLNKRLAGMADYLLIISNILWVKSQFFLSNITEKKIKLGSRIKKYSIR